MKLNRFWVAAIATLTLWSCNKTVEPTVQETPSTTTNTKEIYVELGASQDYGSQEMRAIFGLNNNPDSPDFGKTTGLMMSDKDVVLRVAVRQGDSWPVVQDITFKKTNGRNHATYKGKITVPTDGSGDYKIAAVLLREVDGKVFMTVGREATTPTNTLNRAELLATYNYANNRLIIPDVNANNIEVNIPYISKWQQLIVDGDAARYTTLNFTPQGTLLRMRIRNDDTTEKTFYRVKMVTTSFAHRGSFSMSEEYKNAPTWYPWNEETFYFQITNGIIVPGKSEGGNASYSPWMYTWVMPRKLDYVSRHTMASLGLNPTEDYVYSPAFETYQQLPQGSVPMTLVYYANGNHQGFFGDLDDNPAWGVGIDPPKNPLLRVAEYVLDTTGKAFVTSNTKTNDTNVGYFSFEQISAMKSVQINGVEYHAPSRNELVAIFPPDFDKTGFGRDKVRKVGTYTYDVIESNIQLGNLTKDFKADYYLGDDETIYALRLKDNTNSYRTAFRYRRVGGTYKTADVAIEVSAVFVGNKIISIEDVKNPAFWTNHADEVVTRTYPIYGSTILSSTDVVKTSEGENLIFYSTTPFDEGASYLVFSVSRSGAPFTYVGSGSLLRKTPALLFTK